MFVLIASTFTTVWIVRGAHFWSQNTELREYEDSVTGLVGYEKVPTWRPGVGFVGLGFGLAFLGSHLLGRWNPSRRAAEGRRNSAG